MRSFSPAPEMLFERIVDPVARARGGLYLSMLWNKAASAVVRQQLRTRLLADGWLLVAEEEERLTLYAADSGIDAQSLRALPVSVADGSLRPLAEFCALDLRSAAPIASRSERVQRSIRNNLAAVLTTQGVGLVVDLARWPRVASSVLNYGVELPIGSSASTRSLQRYERAVAKAIRRFEPRLAADSVKVEVVEPETALSQGVLLMRIIADTKPQYGEAGVRLRTLIDMQTGRATTEEESAHAGRPA
jgi:type VI secretion system protein ImpF